MQNPLVTNVGGVELRYARQVVCKCGSVRIGDLVYVRDRRVGKVVHFWCTTDNDESASAQIEMYSPTGGHCLYSVDRPETSFVPITDIVDALIWAPRDGDLVRVISPVVTRVCLSL